MIDNKQYIIMDFPFEQENFQSLKLMNGQFLSYHRNLPVHSVKNTSDTVRYCILGHAIQTDSARKSPIQELASVKDINAIHSVVETWAGRWLLIFENFLVPDACGILGCFYTDDNILSSSLHCINTALHRKNSNPRIRHGFGLDYYPGPDTPYPDTQRLMPSQIYNLTNHTTDKKIMITADVHYANDDERIQAILDYFSTLLCNLKAEYNGKWMVPLTGGYDSRTFLALLEYNHMDYSLFTMEHDNISKKDICIPPLLAKQTGKEYHYIKRTGKPDRKRYQIYDTHCSKMAVDEDRNFYAYHQYPENKENTIILRANIWECAWGIYYDKIKDYGTDIRKYANKYPNIRRRQDMKNSLQKWLTHTKQDTQDIPLANRFYWEQRMGCWLSDVEQSLTIIDNMDSIPLCNCNRLISLLLDFDIKDRYHKQHMVKIIQKTCPELLEIPFEIKDSAKKSRNQKISAEIHYFHSCLSCLGLWEGVKEERRRLMKLRKKK